MRVAVHFPKGHPLATGESHALTALGEKAYPQIVPHDGPSVCAYKLGRIEDGVHNAPVGHDPIPLHEFIAGLVAEAKEEYPDAEVVVERLVQKRGKSEEGVWIPADQFDPEKHVPVGSGTILNREITATAEAAAGGTG